MSTLFLMAGLFLLWFITFVFFRAYIKKRTSPEFILDSLREEIVKLEDDMDRKTEQDIALLEDRIAALREAAAEAEKRLALYARELSRRDNEIRTFQVIGGPKESGLPREKAKPAKKGRAGKGKMLDRMEVLSDDAVDEAADEAVAETPPGTVIGGKKGSADAAASAYRREAGFSVIRGTGGTGEVVEPGVSDDELRQLTAAEDDADKKRAGFHIVRSENPLTAKPAPLRERVAELWRAGLADDLIARRLGISLSETQFYIAMLSNPRRHFQGV